MSLSSKIAGLKEQIEVKEIELTKPEIKKSPEKVKAIKKDLKDLSNLYYNLINIVESKGYRKRQKENIKISIEEQVEKTGKKIGVETNKIIEKVKKQKKLNEMTSLAISRLNKEELNKLKRKAENYNGGDNMSMDKFMSILIWNCKNIFRDNFDYTQR